MGYQVYTPESEKRTPPNTNVPASEVSNPWESMAWEISRRNAVLLQENLVMRAALYKIAELLNPGEQFKNGDEQTIAWISHTVKQCLKEDLVRAVILATEE